MKTILIIGSLLLICISQTESQKSQPGGNGGAHNPYPPYQSSPRPHDESQPWGNGSAPHRSDNPRPPHDACPSRWQYFRNYLYYASDMKSNHTIARQICRYYDRSDLASITDKAEWDFVRCISNPDKKYWFGLYKKDRAPGDTEPGVTSYWLDENPSKFRKWDDDDYRDYEDDDDESDNSGHCVRYTRAGFKDKPCSRSYYFTCKVNADPIATTTVAQKATRNDNNDGDFILTTGEFAGIIAVLVLLLLLVIILIIVVIVLYRRSASTRARNAGNSHDNNAYELPSNANSQYTRPAVYSEVVAPAAESTNATKPPDNGVAQPSAPPQRSSSLHDVTLVDNDLYQ